MLWKLIVAIALGAVAGYLANGIMGGKKNSLLLNILLGIGGGFVGGLIGNLLGIGGGWITGLLLAIGGACLVIWLYRKFFK